MSTDDDFEGLCLAPSTSKWNFARTYYCSEPEGHSPETPHVARSYHNADGDIIWYGPWADGTYYTAPEVLGLEPWKPKND